MVDLGTVDEKTTPDYTATLKDSATGLPIALAQLTGLTLTLYNLASKAIINSRDTQSVLNANNVTFHATSGLLTWSLQQVDTAMAGAGNSERRRAVFDYTWVRSGQTKRDRHIIEFVVSNEPKVS